MWMRIGVKGGEDNGVDAGKIVRRYRLIAAKRKNKDGGITDAY